jgi:flagellar hook-length control protein FliK
MNAQQIIGTLSMGKHTAVNHKPSAAATGGPVGMFADNGALMSGTVQNGGFVSLLQQVMLQSNEAAQPNQVNSQLFLQQLAQTMAGSDEGLADGETASFAQLALQFSEWMEANPEMADQMLQQNSELLAWMQQAATALSGMATSTEPASEASASMKQFLSMLSAPEETAVKLQDMQKLLTSLVKEMNQQPEKLELQQLASQFKEMLQKSPVTQLSAMKTTDLTNQEIPQRASALLGEVSVKQVDKSKTNAALQAQNMTEGQDTNEAITVTTKTKVSALEMLQSKSGFIPTLHNLVHNADKVGMEAEIKPLQVQMTAAEFMNTAQQELAKLANEGQALKTAAPQVPVHQFAQEMTEMMLQNIKFKHMLNGVSEAKISLMPEHLGQVNIKITMQNGQLMAQFTAESLMGKEMLDGQLNQLRASLTSQGIQVDKLEVIHQSNSQSALFQDQKHQQQFDQSGKQQKQKNSQNIELTLEDFLLDFTEDEAFKQREMYGGSFHATA